MEKSVGERPDIPAANIHTIIKYRERLFYALKPYIGMEVSGDTMVQMGRVAAGIVIRKGKQEITDRFNITLDSRPDSAPVTLSVRNLFMGGILDKDKLRMGIVRIAGNLDSIRAGKPVTSYAGITAPYWTIARIKDTETHHTFKRRLRGAMVELSLMTGDAAGQIVSQFFTDSAVGRMGRVLGVTGSREYRTMHHRELVGCAMMIYIKPDSDLNLVLDEYAPRPSLNKLNHTLTRNRRVDRMCPHRFTHACHKCPINYFNCQNGTHSKIYIERLCPSCHNPGWILDGRDNQPCIQCDKKRRNHDTAKVT